MDALGDLAVGRARLAELKTLVAIDRRGVVLDHVHEDVGLPEHLLDRRRRIGIGGCGIVMAKSLLLRANHALRGGDVVGGAGGRDDRKQECEKQDDGAHDTAPLPMLLIRFTSKTGFRRAQLKCEAGESGYSPSARRRVPEAVRPSSPSRRTA